MTRLQRAMVLLGCAICSGRGLAEPQKALIAVGWDMMNPEVLRANQELVDKSLFGGTVIRPRSSDPANKIGHYMFAKGAWDEAWTAPLIENLKACSLAHTTHNFLSTGANPGDVDWFDDAGWADIVQHFRLAARIARQGGLEGLLFDPEPYQPPNSPFDYVAQPSRAEHSFIQYRDKARQRGREVMTAVQEEYPGLTVFSFFMLSVARTAADAEEPSTVLAGHPYGLLPAFIDGWLDVADPATTFIDGCEHAYRFNGENDYLNAAVEIKGICQRLIADENRHKYRAQVQVSFGVYLDAYLNPPSSSWYIDPLGASPVARLRINTETALRVADRYVWIYGEKHNWWPTTHPQIKTTWAEALPGIEDALLIAAAPRQFALRMLAEQGDDASSPLANGSFGPEPVKLADGSLVTNREGQVPAGWGFWQTATSTGTASWDPEPAAAKMSGVTQGCILQGIPVTAGEVYAVSARRRVSGDCGGGVRIRWQTADGKWHKEGSDRLFYPTEVEGEWRSVAGVATVPEGAGRLLVLLGSAGGSAETDCVWWDDVKLARVDQ